MLRYSLARQNGLKFITGLKPRGFFQRLALKEYIEANNNAFCQLIKRMKQYRVEHPELLRQVPISRGEFLSKIDYPIDLGKDLEFICLAELFATIEFEGRVYNFHSGFFSASSGREHDYNSSCIIELAGCVKYEIGMQSRKIHGGRVMPLFYTIDRICNSSLTEAEREEFRKAFFTE